MAPTHIGKYVVNSRLGQGAMGEVYLAEDPFIGRPVAIKWMKSVETGDEQRFLHEARIVGSFSHPNIVVLHDFGFHEEKPFLVMEYVAGPTLEGWLKEAHPLAEHLRIMEGLCGALTYAHERGVLHRDLKPSNIQVLPDGQAKLLDFGIAHAPAAKLTATGIVMGTPSYMAPEILEDALYSPRADIFSAGVLMYEMLAGSNPFAGRTVAATLSNVLHSQPAPLATRADIPRELGEAIMACLARDPDRRPRDLSHLLGVVRRLRTQAAPRPIPRADPSPTRSIVGMRTTGRSRRRASRSLAWSGALAASALAWIVIRVSVLGDAPRPPEPPPATSAAPAADLAPLPAPPATLPAARPRPTPSTPSPRSPSPAPRKTPPPAAADLQAAAPAAAPSAPVPAPRGEGEMAQAAARFPPAAAPTPAPAQAPTRYPTPAPEEPEASITTMSPRTVHRGATLTLRIGGSGFRPEHRVRVLRGRRDAPGIVVTRQRVMEATVVEVNLLVDEDVPLGIYSVALVDGDDRFTNSLTLEVVL